MRPRPHVVAIGGLLLVVACGADTDPIYRDDAVAAPATSVVSATSPPTSVSSSVPVSNADAEPAETVDPAASPVAVDRAYSPENAVAELSGVGAIDTDPVTVDDQPGEVLSFDTFSDGSFVVRVRIVDEGAHTVCVRDACSRVFTRAPDAETREEIEAKIDDALVLAAAYFDGGAVFPDWTVEAGGPRAGTGGTTDVDEGVITVYANRDRTVEEFAVTILHEWGHVVDHELLTDDDRADYRERRGFPRSMTWREAIPHTIESWAEQPGEDFAEVVVAAWTRGSSLEHAVRTSAPAGPPDDDMLAYVRELVARA